MNKNPAKRKRVMDRSLRLGHCVCDPQKSCPCPLLKEKDVCLCAGERQESVADKVALTQLVANAGCASKIDQATLKQTLSGLPFPNDPRVLIGAAVGDDAGVFQIDDERALVQTVDVFTPCVDDPYLFGQIAAANSVSDIYAMGGAPLTALSIVGFPSHAVAPAVLREIFRGGLDKMAEAGVAVIGGHSINDPEIKAGFAVTGIMNPKRVLARANAKPGNILVLTKPIGTGILAFAAQLGRAPAEGLEAAARSMTALNKTAAEIMARFGVHACTDVTGFSLLGHLAEMARGSNMDMELVWDDIPFFPGVLDCAAAGMLPGAVERNRESSGAMVTAGPGVDGLMQDICFDAQTSGGLLMSVEASQAPALIGALRQAGVVAAAAIGRVTGAGAGGIFLRTTGQRKMPAAAGRPVSVQSKPDSSMNDPSNAPCCAHAAPSPANDSSPAGGGGSGLQTRFMDFLKTVNAPGALDAHTKQALALALSVLARCEPCVKAHLQKARAMGFTEEEIDEAAWMAIAFGGSPVMMFYNTVYAAK